MSSLFKKVRDELLENKHRRERGEDIVIPFSHFPKISQVVPGIQKSRYVGVTASMKIGKTSLTDKLFMEEPLYFMYNKPNTNIKLKIYYFSLEVSSEEKVKSLITRKVFEDKNIILSSNKLASQFSDYILDTDIAIDLHTKKYNDFFDFWEDHVKLVDNVRTVEGIMSYMMKVAQSNGKFTVDGVPEPNPKIDTEGLSYEEDDKNLFTIVIVDHVSLFNESKNLKSIKECIDFFSQKCALFMRDKLKYTVVAVQQQNSANEIVQYSNNGKILVDKLYPKANSLGESTMTARDWVIEINTIHLYCYKQQYK